MEGKVLVLGVDGMDPRVTKMYMDKGVLPNIARYVQNGAARAGLNMLGSNPTITPPLWTTLSTGAEPRTHGITCFWNQHPDKLDTAIYNLDSRMCKAEPIWNVVTEAGKKALVWHWPGCSWPPTSDSPNLHVVDGMQPAFVNMATANIDGDKRLYASEKTTELRFQKAGAAADNGSGCIMTDLGGEQAAENGTGKDACNNIMTGAKETRNIIFDHYDGELAFAKNPSDNIYSPITAASHWNDAPNDAKECTLLFFDGQMRRPCLILKNEQGVYDTLAIYKSKKDMQLITQLKVGEPAFCVVDETVIDGRTTPISRTYCLHELAADGSELMLWSGIAYDLTKDTCWHPQTLYQEVMKNVGLIPTKGISSTQTKEDAAMSLKFWEAYLKWQSEAILYLLGEHGYSAIFSHVHNIDADGHGRFQYIKPELREANGLTSEFYEAYRQKAYQLTDAYLGRFAHLLDDGWTILIVSDHGIIIPTEDFTPVIGDGFGLSVPVMRELGYTVMKKDADGNDIKEIDWTKTRAVQIHSTYIYLNIKGRNPEGIVDPADQYELETQIISDLYSYRENGRRVISIALRNKDAIAFGYGGEGMGDIVFFVEEGYNRPHGDALSTFKGAYDTSVSPIFIAAGQGIKPGYTITRYIKQIDVTPTIATLLGVRMPRECEGAAMYQIFA